MQLNIIHSYSNSPQAGFIGMSIMLLSLIILSSLILIRENIIAEFKLKQMQMRSLQLEYQARTTFIEELSSRVNQPALALQDHEQWLKFNVHSINRLLEYTYTQGPTNSILNLSHIIQLINQHHHCPLATTHERTRASIKICKPSHINHSQIIFGNLITNNLSIESNLSLVVFGEVSIDNLYVHSGNIQIIGFAKMSINQITSVSNTATLYLDTLSGDINLPEQLNPSTINPNPLILAINSRAHRGRVLFGDIIHPNSLFSGRTAQYWQNYLLLGWRITANQSS